MRFFFLMAAVLFMPTQAPAQPPIQDDVLRLPRVAVVDFYGLHNVSGTLVTQALGVRPGSPLPDSRLNAEERINDLDRVLASHLEAVCCNEAGDVILYVGIEELNAPHYETRTPPGGADTLPDDVFVAYRDDAGTLPRWTAVANQNMEMLRRVLRESSADQHREAAAFLISYATPAASVTADLEYALRDSAPAVRAVAAKRLVDFAEAAKRDAATGIRVNSDWFIVMLHSLAWTDRIEAARALVALTGPPGNPAVISELRMEALDPLIEMARWKTSEHARPAFTLVGRIAGLTEAEIETRFLRDEREPVISAARGRR